MSDWRLVLSDLTYGEAEQAAVARVLASGWLTAGPEVAAFEEEFARAVGTRHAVAVSSATAGLHLALLAAGVAAGDEVVQPALNFVASANMTRACGATPVFADIAAVDEPTVTRETVEGLLTPQTRAVIVMHYGGTAAAMDGLVELCRERDVALIEDACHAIGACYGSGWSAAPAKPVGGLGVSSCFSFFSNKNLATGEGGMVATDSAEVAATCRLLRSHGMTTMSWERHKGHAYSYDVAAAGFNYRLDELHAALGRVQLEALERNNTSRIEVLQEYERRLPPGWTMPFLGTGRPTSGHLAVLLAPDQDRRDDGRVRLHQARVQTSFHYPLIPTFSAYAASADLRQLPNSVQFAARALTVPLHPRMTFEDVNIVVSALAG